MMTTLTPELIRAAVSALPGLVQATKGSLTTHGAVEDDDDVELLVVTMEEALGLLFEPVAADGFQLADVLVMHQPALELLTASASVLRLPNHPDDLPEGADPETTPTKWLVATRAYGRLLDGWDPEVDYTFPWWLKPVEHTAEEATDALLIGTARTLVPLWLEVALLAAREKGWA